MGNTWPQTFCSVGGHLARGAAVTGAEFEFLFYPPKKKMFWSDFNNAGVLQKSSEIKEHKVCKRRMCSAQVEQIHSHEVMPPPCVLLCRNKRQIKTRKA